MSTPFLELRDSLSVARISTFAMDERFLSVAEGWPENPLLLVDRLDPG